MLVVRGVVPSISVCVWPVIRVTDTISVPVSVYLMYANYVDFTQELIRPPDVSRESLISFTHELSFLSFFFINPPRSAAMQWTAIKCISEVRKWYRDLAHPPLIFTKGQKVRNLSSFSISLKFEPLSFENSARYLNAETNLFIYRNHHLMSSSSLVKMGPRTPENCLSCPTPKIAQRKRAKSSITHQKIIRFRSNFVQSLNAWHLNPKCYKIQGQEVNGKGHSVT